MIEKKKIFYIWKSPYPWDVRVEKICSALVEFAYDVYIICLWGGEEKEREQINNVNVIRVGYKDNLKKFLPIPYNPFWKKSLIKLIEELNPDLIINREIILADISGKLAKKYNIPIIIDMAENYPAAMKLWKKYSNSFLKRLIYHKIDLPTWLERESLKYMNGVIVVCDENGERIKDKYNYKNKIVTIYNTPSKDFFNFKRFELNREFTTIAYHGYINYERNLEKCLNVGRKFEKLRFEVWGSGIILEELMLKFKDFSNIEFKGEYKLSDLKEIIQNTDIGILPYSLNEHIHNTISNKLFDYMACGIPILTSEANAMINLINKYEIGYYRDFENEDSIYNTFSEISKLEWQSKGKNGFNIFQKKFNWENDKLKLKEFIGGFL